MFPYSGSEAYSYLRLRFPSVREQQNSKNLIWIKTFPMEHDIPWKRAWGLVQKSGEQRGFVSRILMPAHFPTRGLHLQPPRSSS